MNHLFKKQIWWFQNLIFWKVWQMVGRLRRSDIFKGDVDKNLPPLYFILDSLSSWWLPCGPPAFSCLQGVWTHTCTVYTTYLSKYSWGIVIAHLFISFDHSASPQGGGMAEMGQPLGGRGCTIGNRGSPTWYDIFFFYSCYINVFRMIKSDLFVEDENRQKASTKK